MGFIDYRLMAFFYFLLNTDFWPQILVTTDFTTDFYNAEVND